MADKQLVELANAANPAPVVKKRRRKLRFVVTAFILLLELFLCLVLALFAFWVLPVTQGVSSDDLKIKDLGQNSVIYARDGTRLAVVPADRNRTVVSYAQMGVWLPKSTVAIEDRRFWQHDGLDVHGIIRAAVNNIDGHDEQGASTITQQLVRSIYPNVGDEKTYDRKLREMKISWELEHKWEKKYGKNGAKEHILELYLNSVFFGHQAYGVQAAALTYWGIPANKLSIAQAATLSGIIQQPSGYDPVTNPDAVIRRRNTVLSSMYNEGMITALQETEAQAAPLALRMNTYYGKNNLPYFVGYVERQLSSRYGEHVLQAGGLQIHTTIDMRAQQKAVRAIHKTLDEKNDPAAAMVMIDNKTGQIRAMASSTQYQKNQFDLTTQAVRQPGSSAKIWALAEVLRRGYDPDKIDYTSEAISVRKRGQTAWWEPKTYDGSYPGKMNLHEATVKSDNSIFAQLTLDLGPRSVAAMAERLGIDRKLSPVQSIALGGVEVTPLEQTNVYSTIARGGVKIEPISILNITQLGTKKVFYRATVTREHALQDWQAAKIVQILTDNVKYGTGTGAQLSGHQVAGKTGTTNDYKDAWFCGMTPDDTSCVWVGYIHPKPMTDVHGIHVAGGTLPADIWAEGMKNILPSHDMNAWPTSSSPVYNETPYKSTWEKDPNLEIRIPFIKHLGNPDCYGCLDSGV